MPRDEPRKLVYAWGDGSESDSGLRTIVTWTLTPVDGGTEPAGLTVHPVDGGLDRVTLRTLLRRHLGYGIREIRRAG